MRQHARLMDSGMEVCQHVNVSEHSILAALNWTKNKKLLTWCLKVSKQCYFHNLATNLHKPSFKWLHTYLPAALVNCGIPQSFPNGTFTLVNGSTTLNSTVKYECRMGHYLVGSANMICQRNGQWVGMNHCTKVSSISKTWMTGCSETSLEISCLSYS